MSPSLFRFPTTTPTTDAALPASCLREVIRWRQGRVAPSRRRKPHLARPPARRGPYERPEAGQRVYRSPLRLDRRIRYRLYPLGARAISPRAFRRFSRPLRETRSAHEQRPRGRLANPHPLPSSPPASGPAFSERPRQLPLLGMPGALPGPTSQPGLPPPALPGPWPSGLLDDRDDRRSVRRRRPRPARSGRSPESPRRVARPGTRTHPSARDGDE